MGLWAAMLTFSLAACSSGESSEPVSSPDAALADVTSASGDASPGMDVTPDVLQEEPTDVVPGEVGLDAPSDSVTPDAPPPVETGCNGTEALCDRRYDEVCFPTTHNSMSNADGGWFLPNQTHGLTRQLEDGIRGLMLDVHPFDGKAYLCHGVCDLGKQPLVEGLEEIADFLASHPREVVTIIFEAYVPASDIAAGLSEAGLDALLYAHPDGTEWPTLRALIDAGTRLVVFAESGGGEPAWYHRAWDAISDTNYAAQVPADLVCDLNRGALTHDLFLINNFMGNPLPGIELATQVNFNPFLGGRAQSCAAERDHIPNFIGVDFYKVGDLFAVVRDVNGLPPL